MAGSLRKLKNNKWELCVHVGYNLNGKRIRKYKYVTTHKKSEAEKLLSEFVAECKGTDYDDREQMTLKDYSEFWFRDYVEKSLRKKTISDYKDIMERILSCLGHKKIGEIKPTHLVEFYNILSSDGVRKDGKPGGLSP